MNNRYKTYMKNITEIIILDDDKSTAQGLEKYLRNKNFNCKAFFAPETAIEYINKNKVSILISDLKMNKLSGLDVLEKVKEISPFTSVIIITVKAIKAGADDFILKPLNLDELVIKIQLITKLNNLQIQNKVLNKFVDDNFAFDGIVGSSAKMQKVVKIIKKVSPLDTSVVIMGETGVGKEIVANAIHKNSNRSQNEFVTINCAALNSNLIESELFGHSKSSFTGASKEHIGRIELADEGTLFLDEITDVPFNVQTKLLRVLETKSFEKVGL